MNLLDWVILLVIFLFISVYGIWRGRATGNNSRDVLIGSGMSVVSVALSVCSTFISSISMLGFPAEVYYYGSMIGWYAVAYFIAFPAVAYLFLPTLYNHDLNSIYEYLEYRFNKPCKILAVVIFCCQTVLYNAVALYAPAMAVSTMMSLSLEFTIAVTATLAALYISIGGAKAGVHTSALQMVLIVLTMGVIVFINIREHPVKEAFSVALRGGRLNIMDFRPDPRIRHSGFAVLIGATCNIVSLFAANQLSMQRFLAMPTLRQAQQVVLMNIGCNLVILTGYIFTGILIFARYSHCDPQLLNINELFPRFVLDSFSHLPGMNGLFIAALYSAGISTLSGSFSALSNVILKDVVIAFSNRQYSEETLVKMSKFMPLGLALITAFIAWLCKFLQSLVLQIAFSVFGAVGGPVLGTFIAALFIPRIRGTASIVGLVFSLGTCLVIALGAIFNKITPVRLPLDSSCGSAINMTADPTLFGKVMPIHSDSIWINITEISYQYYGLIGVLVNISSCLVFQYIADLFPLKKEHTKTKADVATSLL